MEENIQKGNRILIKIGSAIIAKNGKFDKEFLKNKVKEISNLIINGKKIILITSGAVVMGMEIENLKERPLNTAKLQLLSGKGQVRLMNKYAKYFWEHNIDTAQILLTHHNFLNESEVKNLRDIINGYLEKGDIPIINTNDVVTKDELTPCSFSGFSDNDQLAALVAVHLDVNLMLILTNVDGLYEDNPYNNHNAKLIKNVTKVTDDIENMAKRGVSKNGLGGMYSKVMSAKIAMEKGISTIVAHGKYDINKILENKVNRTTFSKKV